jgi:glycosyltransferase involved in cell wall biosynthesis
MSILNSGPAASRTARLAYLVSHPIQYQAPLLRRIAREPGIDLTVLYGSDFSVRGYKDEGFGVDVKWDIPLLEGYRSEFLPALRDNRTEGTFSPISRGITHRLAQGAGGAPFDAVWVHGYATVNQIHAILAAKSLGLPVIVRAESWLSDRPRSGLKLAAKQVFFAALKHLIDAVLVTGQPNRAYWEHYLGPDFPMFPMPYAVDNQWFQARAQQAATGRAEMQARFALDPARPVILFASKLQTRKHCNDLIAAYAKLSPAPGRQPHPYLLIVGDGEERAALEQQAKATGFSSIHFAGFVNQSEMPRFFDLASVFVLPSRHEPWGLIVNEVMNAARAVIVSSDVGCAADLITGGVEGFVYPVRDVDALADALRKVFATPETAAAMGANALARISNWGFEQDVAGLHQAIAAVTRGRAAQETY